MLKDPAIFSLIAEVTFLAIANAILTAKAT